MSRIPKALISVPSVMASLALMPESGIAQQGASALELDEVVVQARRMDEDVQKVPVTVTVVTPQTVSEMNITAPRDFMKAIPAFKTELHISSGGASGNLDNGTYSALRGIQGITVYFADAPNTLGNPGNFLDVASLQVLKGPQGTLFGGNAAAGAFVSMPVRPSNDHNGYLTASAGSYGRHTFEGASSFPIIEDKLMVRVSAKTHHRNGYVKDINTKLDYQDEDYDLGRLQLTYKPFDGLENNALYQYYDSKTHGGIAFLGDYNPQGLIANIYANLFGNPTIVDSETARHIRGYGDLGLYRVDNPTPNHGWIDKDRLFINNTRWDMSGNMSLTNVATYRANGNQAQANIDFTGTASVRSFLNTQDPRQFDNPIDLYRYWYDELTFRGSFMDGKLETLLGGIAQGPAENPKVIRTFSNALGADTVTGSKYSYKAQGIFANANFDLSDRVLEGLKVSAGYRRSWQQLRTSSVALGFLPPPVPVETFPVLGVNSAEGHFQDDSWTGGLQWEFNPNAMVYFTAARGITPGTVSPNAPSGFQVARPEQLTTYELGLKSQFPLGDWQFRTNVAGYVGTFKDVQTPTFELIQVNPLPAPPTLVNVIKNNAEIRVKGIDLELAVAPTDWIEIDFAGLYNGNEFKSFPFTDSSGVTTDIADQLLIANSPKYKFTLNAHLTAPNSLIRNEYGKVSLNVYYTHTSLNAAGSTTIFEDALTRVQSVANGYGPEVVAAGGGTRKVYTDGEAPFHSLDLSVNWDQIMGSDAWSANFTVSNVDNQVHLEQFHGEQAFGFSPIVPGAPRMFVGSLTYKF